MTDPFAAYNRGIIRARLDYEREPNRACDVEGCPALVHDSSQWCGIHRRAYNRPEGK